MKKLIFISLLFVMNISAIFSGQWHLSDHAKVRELNGISESLIYKKISYFDSLNIIAIGNENDVEPFARITSDGGKNWITCLWDSSSKFVNSPKIICGDYKSSGLCILIGDSGYYYRSIDFCKTWNKYQLVNKLEKLVLINMYDDYFGFMMSYKHIYITENGGLNWKQLALNVNDSISDYSVNGLSIVNRNFFYTVLYDPFVDKTYLMGHNIEKQESRLSITSNYTCSNLFFIDSLNGFLSAAIQYVKYDPIMGSAIIHSTNGGADWNIQLDTLPNITNGLGYINFLDDLNGLSFYYANIWRTSDGGNFWYSWDIRDDLGDYAGVLMEISQISKNLFYSIDSEGNIWKYSDETSVSEPQNQEPFSIFPNPAQTTISVTLPEAYLSGKIEIYSLEGILIQEIQNTNKIDVSCLCAGVYFVKVRDKFKKFIKL